MKKRKLFFIFLFYLILILAVFGDLPKTFFQQDEWAIFGNLLYWQKTGLNWFERLFIYEQDVHILPFSNLLSFIQFRLFDLNFAPYAVFSILLHFLNSFLVFYLSYLILRKRWLSLVVGLLFAVNSISHQAVTWVATTTGTVGACFFMLLALVFFVKQHLALSTLMVIFSLGFKETSLFLFALLPVFWLLFSKKVTFQKAKKVFIPLFIFGFFYFCLRFFLFINAPPPSISVEAVSQPTSPIVYLYRFFTLPAKAISQSLVPASLILNSARVMVKLAYPHFAPEGIPDPYIVESVAADIISYALTVMILALAGACRGVQGKRLRRGSIFALAFIAFGSLPLMLIPGRAGYFSIFEPRHFYIFSFGSSLLLGILIFALSGILKRVQDDWLRKILFFIFLTPLILFHASRIRFDIRKQVEIGRLRKSILNQISSTYPQLPEKVIFYTESDKAFYGLPPEEKILPFQSGFGQTLLVWYDMKGEEFPACFFKEKFLYVLLNEDYKFCQERGFGYFRKFDKLAEAVKKNNLSKESVIAFSYNSEDNSLNDITQKIRNRL